MRVFVVFGTRPEAIKMCPLVLQIKKHKEFQCVVCLTGQHREMLDQVMKIFGIEADYDLDLMKKNQTLVDITTSVMTNLEPILQYEKPDIVLVHGDTTTSYTAAMTAFYQHIPVGHVEAGLRTGNIHLPFPEEMNRIITDKISDYHFAPTYLNERNLMCEGIDSNVYVTGNTIIDSFGYTVRSDYVFHDEQISKIDFNNKRVILVTAHRRENWGQPLINICKAIESLASRYEDVVFVYPVHLNPIVKDTVYGILKNIDNVTLTEPVDVMDMHNMLARCYMVMTDSGGIQEEAPHFGKPVLVLRTETERPEAVEAGTVRVVGIKEQRIIEEAEKLIVNTGEYNKMARAVNPYGDGHASERIVEVLREFMKT